jgi:TRAP-type C4-dicarboxylate transport system substrate-binding protein
MKKRLNNYNCVYLHYSKQLEMEIQSLKLDLVNKIIHTEDQSVLIKINKILSDEISKDWWDELPKEVQESIFEGIKDVEEGRFYTHENVMQEAKQKYGF